MLAPIPEQARLRLDCMEDLDRQSTACTRQRRHSFYRFRNLIKGLPNSIRGMVRAKTQPDIENQLPRDHGNSCQCSSTCMSLRCEILIGLVLVALGMVNLNLWMHQAPNRSFRDSTVAKRSEPGFSLESDDVRLDSHGPANRRRNRRTPEETSHTSLGTLGVLSTIPAAAGAYYWTSAPEETVTEDLAEISAGAPTLDGEPIPSEMFHGDRIRRPAPAVETQTETKPVENQGSAVVTGLKWTAALLCGGLLHHAWPRLQEWYFGPRKEVAISTKDDLSTAEDSRRDEQSSPMRDPVKIIGPAKKVQKVRQVHKRKNRRTWNGRAKERTNKRVRVDKIVHRM